METATILVIFVSSLLLGITTYSVYTAFGPAAKNLDPLTGLQAYQFAPNVFSLRTITGQDIVEKMTTGTEIVSSRRDLTESLTYASIVGGVRAERIQDDNNLRRFWFNYFKLKLEKEEKINEESPIFIRVDLTPEGEEQTVIIRDLLGVCGDSEACVIYSKAPIIIDNESDQPFVCDRKALIMSEADIYVDPDMETPEDSFTGCIIISNQDVIIQEGEFRSREPIDPDDLDDPGVVGYDYLQAFVMAERQIRILKGDEEKTVSDGLEVKGSLLAFGSGLEDAEDRAISIERGLGLYNLTNPVLVIGWDTRYAKMSEFFFGRDANLYKQEVGFKVF